MDLASADVVAARIREALAPHCYRIEIAGSIRRRKAQVGDIEVVCIPRPYEVGLFESGIATVVDHWVPVRGELPGCRYTRRRHPEGIDVDLFFARPENWGLILAIRTGSAGFSHHFLANGWVKHGYTSFDGMLTKDGIEVPMPEEEDVFRAAGVPWTAPEERVTLSDTSREAR